MDRYLDWSQLKTLVPYCRQHVLRMEERGQFPKRRWLSPNRVAWLESEILEWLASRQRGAPPQSKHLGPKPAPAPQPDAEELELLHRLAAKLGLDLVPTRPERKRRGGSLP